MDHLESFIADCDRRTELAKKRLAETQEEISAEVAAKVGSAYIPCSVKMSVGNLIISVFLGHLYIRVTSWVQPYK